MIDLRPVENRYHSYMARWDAGPPEPDDWHRLAAASADDVNDLVHEVADLRWRLAKAEGELNRERLLLSQAKHQLATADQGHRDA